MLNSKTLFLAAIANLALFLGVFSVAYNTPETKQNDVAIPQSFISDEQKPIDEKPKEKILPSSVSIEVPFTPQSPFGNWQDPHQQNGCEEASVIMAMHWANGEELTPQKALKEIKAISDYENEEYGYFADTSAEDTIERIFRKYFQYDKTELQYDIGLKDIKEALSEDKLVIVPVNGRALKNPYFTPPGPIYHMIVITGYDDEKQTFVTHDPGTRYGKNFQYSYETISSALGDYESGNHKFPRERRIAMILVSK